MALTNSRTCDADPHRKGPRAHNDRRYELGPHSALFRRGSIAGLNGNTREAKFIKTFEKAILDHLGGANDATIPQRLYAGRLAKIALRLELFDQKLADLTLTEFDSKVMGGLTSQYRLMLRELLGTKRASVDHARFDPHLDALMPMRGKVAT